VKTCRLVVASIFALSLAGVTSAQEKKDEKKPDGPVSFYKDIRPILQASCHGCHQPARPNGKYEMTTYANLIKGGETEEIAVVPGDPAKSNLVSQIEVLGGKAAMPKDKPALKDADIALIKRWIAEGAKDDTPASARPQYDMAHPPVYNLPPVITSLDFSPDSKTLAVSGYHEVLLHDVSDPARQGDTLTTRLVGLSERIESAVFSPDGKKIAVSGGLPGRMGEIQIWDLEKKQLTLSVPTTFDTIYGAAWSPDMAMITYGCGDNALRGINTTSGEQVLFMGSHTDWVLDTIVSRDGKSVISVGRDMTVKMTDVGTQRFLGNVTTHTPGVLKGGMTSVDRHPARDEVVAGCADGRPKLFAMKVDAAPAGGGNPNQIREFEAMTGRVFDVAFSNDGARFVAGSSLDGKGQAWVFETDSGKKLFEIEGERGGVFSVAWSPDGKLIAVGGFDGEVHLADATTGKLIKKFVPVAVEKKDVAAK
jgi:WD40 repeat protein/mono/diheme cytochrome c family protein